MLSHVRYASVLDFNTRAGSEYDVEYLDMIRFWIFVRQRAS